MTFNYYCDEQWQCIVNGDQVLIIFNWSKPSVKQVSWILDIYNYHLFLLTAFIDETIG